MNISIKEFNATIDNKEDYEVYDEETGCWVLFSQSCYSTKNGGFPKPSEAAYPINAITHYDNIDDTFYVLHLINEKNPKVWSKELSDRPEEILNKIQYQSFETEEELLRAYVNLFDDLQPHIFTGWNSSKFDIPYIVNRIENVLGSTWVKRLSVWRKIKEKQIRTNFGKTELGYNILGLSDLDYMEVYKKQTFTNQEFYSLDHISHVELGERKVSYEEQTNLYNLIGDMSRNVKVDENRNYNDLQPFEKKCRVRDRLKKEMIKRGLDC